MEDYKTIIYILIGALYLFFSYRRKKQQASKKTGRVPRQAPAPSRTYSESTPERSTKNNQRSRRSNSGVTLEELLGNFNTKKEQKKKQEKPYEVVFSEEKKLSKKHKPLIGSLLTEQGNGAFFSYKIRKEEKNRYAEILKAPQGARDAFIASEIFNRKYD